MVVFILIFWLSLFVFSIFLNTPIRRTPRKIVTAKWPLLGVEAVFVGKAGFGVGEKVEKVSWLMAIGIKQTLPLCNACSQDQLNLILRC
jgi:hypothetical protein